jgi:hypothetical protein
LRDGNGGIVPVTLTVGADRSSVALRPAVVLEPNSLYSVRVAGLIDVSGNTQPETVDTTFRTGPGFDLQGPEVLNSDPPDGATGVPLNSIVRIVFSEPVIPDASGFSLDSGRVPIEVRFDDPATTAVVTPLTALEPSGGYLLRLSVRDLAGNWLSSNSPWITFSTAP